ncbi:leukotriene A-4 hydrolase [Diorhabda sublineata]|uniref:leukotriene A-4 hydrolase n=1 Tax=Diorhabda sublineata TaxID=1163346 RepID=UPI0024E11DDD|nr:leukotriene A-4 hydrolase [Diorhabda sublineata]
MKNVGLSPCDPSSFSRPDQVIVTDIFLNLNIHFNSKTLNGHTILSVEKIQEECNELTLDAFKLKISSICEVDTKEKLEYQLSDHLEDFGSKLIVQLPKTEANSFKICIEYETSPEASGLQWLSPQATSGKKHPFLFSQFQPTHARSVLPCQDTPSVKQTYKATILAPKDMTVLMSAIKEDSTLVEDNKQSNFNQTVPVPSYLIALAVGSLESRKLGPRSHVWAEKEIIEDCAYEFALTEHQLKTAEEICGPYVWGVYDLLVLPPSFPYGGMENPCLTFVTPTLLAGDRSLANVIAHEIAHSWTGNLVTNKTFEHFWLNEGFTMFVERKIIGKLTSAQMQDFDAYAGVSDLEEAISVLGADNPLTNLVVDLRGIHPDEAFSTVPYEKGQTFLRYLESSVGGPEKFEPFLRAYFETFKYKSIETSDFQQFFESYFSTEESIKNIPWQKWLHTPGMPLLIPDYDKSLAVACDALLEKFRKWTGYEICPITAEVTEKLMPEQRIYFLQKLCQSEKQPIHKLKILGDLFYIQKIKNAEIKFHWLKICLKARWEEKIQEVLDWINVVGRMKFVRPLYRELYQWEVSKNRAIENFKANKNQMMHICTISIAKDLKLD